MRGAEFHGTLSIRFSLTSLGGDLNKRSCYPKIGKKKKKKIQSCRNLADLSLWPEQILKLTFLGLSGRYIAWKLAVRSNRLLFSTLCSVSKLRVTFPRLGARFTDLCARCAHICSLNSHYNILEECTGKFPGAQFQYVCHPHLPDIIIPTRQTGNTFSLNQAANVALARGQMLVKFWLGR